MAESDKPRVFISYAHPSRAMVRQLREVLCDAGFEVACDLNYEPLPPPTGWKHWMRSAIRDSQVVLMFCCADYAARFDGESLPGVGRGVHFESRVILDGFYELQPNNRKFFPIVPDGGSDHWIPEVFRDYGNGFEFPSDAERILELCRRATDGESPRADRPAGLTPHERAAFRRLVEPLAAPYLENIAGRLGLSASMEARSLALAVVDWMSDPTDSWIQITDRLVAVRAALHEVASDTTDAAMRQAAIRGAMPLYWIAAAEAIDQEMRHRDPEPGKARVQRLMTAPQVVMAIVATALFGGTVHVETHDGECQAGGVHAVDLAAVGEQWWHEFERKTYLALFETRKDSTKMQLGAGPLDAKARKRLIARVRTIRRVEEQSLALVIRLSKMVLDSRLDEWAAMTDCPVLVEEGELAEAILAVDMDEFVSEIEEFVAQVEALELEA